MKLINTNKGRIVISVYKPVKLDQNVDTAEFVYVIPAGESFDPMDVGFKVLEKKEYLSKEMEK